MPYLLLIEVDPWYLAGAFVAGFISLGMIATAIKAIRGEIWTPFRKWIKAAREKRQKTEELIISVDELKITTEQIAAELRTNGGSSIKDILLRVEKSSDYTTAKLRHMDEKSKHALFEIDARGNWTFANATLCELFGSDEADLLNKNWLVKIAPEDKRRLIEELNDAIDNRCPLNIKVGLLVEDDKTAQIRIQATPHVKAGSLIGFFGLVTPLEQKD